MSINLEQVLGFRVKVTNTLDVVTQGKVYSYNSGNGTLTLLTSKNQQPLSFKIIKSSFIKHLEVVGDKPPNNGFKKDPFKPSQVDLERVNRLLNANIKDAKEREALRGKGVSSEGQFIFASLYKTMTDTKWVDKSIVVLGDVEIQPPYLVKNIKSLHEPEASSMHLVKKIVEGAWNKLESERKGG